MCGAVTLPRASSGGGVQRLCVRAVGSSYDPARQIVVINPVTTLVSRVLDERPDLKPEGAEAHVRSFLDLTANYSLGMALQQSSGYRSRFFSPVALLTEAQAAGGLDAFEHLLLQELLASDTH